MQWEWQWEDEFFKYIIDQRVASIRDVNWTLVLKEKPFLTKKQITLVLSHAKERVEIKGPLYEQIAAFRSRRSTPKWIEERKVEAK